MKELLEKGTSLNPEVVGRKIREIRKEKKNLTIIQLAQKLGYATGKLSNIERGKRAKFPLEELEVIAKVLEEPLETFLKDDSDYLNELEHIKQKISLAKHRLSAGLVTGLKPTLTDLQETIEKVAVHDVMVHLNFLWAEYYRGLCDYDLASEYYKEILNTEVYDKEAIEIKMRTFNALASLQIHERQLKEAVLTLRTALNFIEKHDGTLNLDKANVHYNLTLIYFRLGYLDLAEYHVQSCLEITKGKNEQAYYYALYLLSITYWLKQKFEQARKLLFESMNWFQRQKDLGSLFNSLEFIFFIYQVKPNLIFIEMLNDIREFLNVVVPDHILPQKLRCFFRYIEFEIERENYLTAHEMLDICKGYLSDNSIEDGYKAYLLEAILIRITSKNMVAEIHALEKALTYFSPGDRSLQKASVLSQLGKLKATCENIYYEEALSIFDEIYNKQVKFDHTILSLLPNAMY
ncbi:XRE family transcriptional regulator [Paenibacillus oralis]|uniref:XRE family transcriptional regulator n=1 Tax=Paenibacillus oralis TaxID=2490856 RepID=A0A3P3TBT7_9BACL|nr:helix-turn-helix transcriptional regulator [Paenibacillus oralis]RRJ54979.1 XRE family transcriptional regulator [Paenibacillus oralis]